MIDSIHVVPADSRPSCLKTWGIESLADPCPFWYLCSMLAFSYAIIYLYSSGRTVYSLPIPLDFAIEDCVLVLW
jgi:hypothetical protein